MLRTWLLAGWLALPCGALADASPGEDPAALGLAIAEEAHDRNAGWIDQRARLRMVLRDAAGHEHERHLRVDTLEVIGDGDKSMLVFDSPRDIKGTALLTYSHPIEPDDQWLYLPALKRVKRISSANKSGPFVGSEFAYEDFSSQEVEKYTYRYLRDVVEGARALPLNPVWLSETVGAAASYSGQDPPTFSRSPDPCPVPVPFFLDGWHPPPSAVS